MTGSATARIYCDRQTRPPVDGMRTIYGQPYEDSILTLDQLRAAARPAGWRHAGQQDYYPEHVSGPQAQLDPGFANRLAE